MLLKLCLVTCTLQSKISGNVQISQTYLVLMAYPFCKLVVDSYWLSYIHSLPPKGKRLSKATVSEVDDILFQKRICCSFLTGCKTNTGREITEAKCLKAKSDLERNSIKVKQRIILKKRLEAMVCYLGKKKKKKASKSLASEALLTP